MGHCISNPPLRKSVCLIHGCSCSNHSFQAWNDQRYQTNKPNYKSCIRIVSGWCDVFQAPHGSLQAGSEDLVICLRNYFSHFGVPSEILSDDDDDDPEFVLNNTETFLEQ